MASKLLKIVLSVIALSFLAKVAFGLTMIVSIQAFLAKEDAKYAAPQPTLYVAGGVPDLPDLQYVKDLNRPLLLSDRARLSFQLKGALGRGTDGWTLRYNSKKDAIALRPDQKQCLRDVQHDCYTVATRHKAEVFSKGKKRLYVYARYQSSGIFQSIDKDEFDALNDKYPSNRWSAVRPGWANSEYLKKDWVELEPWNGFTLRRLENKGGNGAYFLTATLEGDGKITLSMITNAPLDDVKAQLSAIDLDLLRAMVAPVPFGGLANMELYLADTLSQRSKGKRVAEMTPEAIRNTVASMEPRSRLKYVTRLLRHAREFDNSPFDYDVLYQPIGAQGLQDTREFLAGKIAEDDVRYGLLALEQERNLAIGSCITTAAGQFCRSEAKHILTALEVRRQSAAATAADGTSAPVTEDIASSEQNYLEEMQGLERQMDAILQRLAANQAGE